MGEAHIGLFKIHSGHIRGAFFRLNGNKIIVKNKEDNKVKKRFLSTVLVFALIFSQCAVVLFDAYAADDVAYDRAKPEAAILNAYTGTDAGFYESLKSNAYSEEYPEYYNAAQMFSGGHIPSLSYDALIADDKTGTDDGRLYFDQDGVNWGNSVLRSVSKATGNLSVNLSVSLFNNIHTHKCSAFKKQDVKAFEKVSLFMSNSWCATYTGASTDMETTFARFGDYTEFEDNYQLLNYINAPAGEKAFLQFAKSSVKYNNGKSTCTCGGASASRMLVTYRDMKAPSAPTLTYSTDGGKTWNRATKKGYVGTGTKLALRLEFDEPIRFADDKASHGDLYLELRQRGATAGDSNPKAYLKELSGNCLYFDYTVQKSDGTFRIAEVYADSLFKNSVELKQVYRDKSFTLKKTGKGFTETDSYITDLAGNAMSKASFSINVDIDNDPPKVKEVVFNPSLNNADVMEALGDDGEENASHRYLGEGDCVTIDILTDEKTNVAERLMNWDKLTAVTNIVLTDGKVNNLLGDKAIGGLSEKTENGKTYLAITCSMASLVSAGDGTGESTAFYMPTIPIHSNMVTEDGGMIKIKYLIFNEKVTDLAGNEYSETEVSDSAQSKSYLLDTEGAELEDKGYTEKDYGFAYSFDISDSVSGSEGIFGSFVLNNGGDKKAYAFEYAVTTGASDTPKTWTEAMTGEKVRFIQHDKNALHIRAKEGETYEDLSSCTITVNAKDYAGNEKTYTLPDDTLSTPYVIGWYMDGMGPEVSLGGVERALTADGGILTAELSVSDRSGISDVSYSWDNKTWIDATASRIATANVNDGESFAKELFVKATDKRGNVTEISLGKIAYDLTAAKYAMSYKTSIEKKAQMLLTEISADDEIVLMVKVPESVAGVDNRYAAMALTSADVTDGVNLFGYQKAGDNYWYHMTVTENGGVYAFDAVEGDKITYNEFTAPREIYDSQDTNVRTWWRNIVSGNYSGEIEVTVLSGKREAFGRFADSAGTEFEERYAPKSAGNDEYAVSKTAFTLRVIGEAQSFENVTLTSSELAEAKRGGIPHTLESENLYSTISGKTLDIEIGKDVFGWNYENLKLEDSYISVVNANDASSVFSFGLNKASAVNTDGKLKMSIKIPEHAFETGVYNILLHIECKAGNATEVYFNGNKENVFVDATEPDNNFSLSSVIYKPASQITHAELSNLGINESERVTDSDVIYLPTYGQHNGEAYYSDEYILTVETPDETVQTIVANQAAKQFYAGQYSVVMWNEDPSLSDKIMELNAYSDDDVSKITNQSGSFGQENSNKRFMMIDSASQTVPGNYYLYLLNGKVNTVGVKKVYANGKESETKYYKIYADDSLIKGKISKEPGSLIFTPEEGADLTGTKVYAYMLDGSRTDNTSTFRAAEEMTAYSDGTYRYPLNTTGAEYIVFTVNRYGSVYKAASEAIEAPWFSVDEPAEIVTDENGKYEIHFKTMLNFARSDEGDKKFTVKFGEEYAKLLDSDAFSFVFKENSGEYAWEADSASPTGIYKVSANAGVGMLPVDKFYQYSYIDTVIYGVLPDTLGEAVTITAEISVEDSLGLKETCSVSSSEAIGKSEVKNATYTPGTLTIAFNQPVRPTESLVWHESDAVGSYFKSEWVNAFPVTENGEHEISYYDVFGKLRSETLSLTDTFIYDGTDYGINITVSPEENTTEPVTVTAKAHGDGKVIFKEWYEDGEMPIAPIDGTAAWEPTAERAISVEENKWVKVYRTNLSGQIHTDSASIKIYIDNIVKGAPEAKVKYYLESVGREFTYDELETYIDTIHNGSLESKGKVMAYYRTSRHVTPQNDETHIYEPGENIYTFRYVDDYGNEGSAVAELPDGLTVTEIENPPADTAPPEVYVDVYAKRFEKYSKEDAFNVSGGDAAMQKSFSDVGTVQGYSLKLTVRDESAYEIRVTESENIKLTGNSISVLSPEEFTVTVTDEAGNATEFTVTEAMLSYIDNIAPRAQTEIVQSSMYSRDGYIRLYDVDSEGNEITGEGHSVSLVSPSGLSTEIREGKTWYKVPFDENKDVHFSFHDEAGNYGSDDISVRDIDSNPPEIDVTWSPPYLYEDNGETKTDSAMHTEGPVNTNVTAHVNISSPIVNAIIEAEGAAGVLMLPNGIEQEIVAGGIVSAKAAAEKITVTYKDNFDGYIHVTVTAQNGQTTDTYIGSVENVIDKKVPSLTESKESIYKTGSTAPYGYSITLTPDEEVRFMNAGEKEADGTATVYDMNRPLELKIFDDTEKELMFTDFAGNVGKYKVEVKGLDRTAPTLTLIYPDDNPNLLRPTSGTVEIGIKSDEDCTVSVANTTMKLKKDEEKKLSFSENGSHLITATDGAGNKSEYTVTVNCIDRTLPMISFDSSTVYGFAGISDDEIKALLETGYTAWDNVSSPGWPTVALDISEIDTGTAGAYKAHYTVTDEAGNSITVSRFVRILGSDTVYIKVNGEAVLPNSTKEIKPGKVSIEVMGLSDNEPYTVKIRRGLKSKGQMKYLKDSSVTFENGECNIESAGYYTVLVTTQSRQTVLLKLYAQD